MKQETKDSFERYIKRGIPTGDFLRSVLTNDLVGAFSRADSENLRDLKEIVEYLYLHVPSGAWRTEAKVDDWIDKGGLEGLGLLEFYEKKEAMYYDRESSST